jgi:tetratricopeptide (TPR) repeat protein
MTIDGKRVEGSALQSHIDDLWDFDDPAASESRFLRAAGEASTDGQRDILLTQVARALGLQAKYSEGIEILDSILNSEATASVEVEVRTRLERGRILNTRGDRDDARPEFEAAFEGASAAALESLAVDALHMIAIVAPPDEQMALNQRAIAIAEAATDPRARGWLPSLYNNTGWTHFDAGNLDEALQLFELALVERLKVGKPREIGIARWAVARTFRAQGRIEEALAAQRELARFNAETEFDDPYVEEELGECLLALGRSDEARPHFARAAQGISADAWMLANEHERVARLQELGGSGSDSGLAIRPAW